PENYEIGLRSGTWGVEEKYESKIKLAKPSDKLLFVVGGFVRSIHTITSEPYLDTSPLWPPKDGSMFPHRIHFSEAEASGSLPLKSIANEISFMRGKVWGGTIQGANGVFNPHLTPQDLMRITEDLGGKSQQRRPAPPAPNPTVTAR